jgi:N-acetylglucosaminyldiphosphoundecaprenol N-acetyl-beta-D-mannosaminyltransferase
MTESDHLMPNNFLTILGTRVFCTSYELAVENTKAWALGGESKYVCMANVHMLMEAYGSSNYHKFINAADLVTPDGMPLVWMMRLKGQKNQKRVYGPTLMLLLLQEVAKEKIPIGFYGGSPDVLTNLVLKMKERFSGLNVVYAYSPPFRDLDEAENRVVVQEMKQSGLRILFVGLGCPKQEIWMAEHQGEIKAVMLGVGAAFDFHAGFKPQAPAWMQRLGLEWLYRLYIEPRRLWKRYLYHNPRFVLLAILDLLGVSFSDHA